MRMEPSLHHFIYEGETKRLDAVMAAQVSLGLSRAQAQRLIAEHQVMLNDKPCTSASQKVAAGQAVIVTIPPPEPLELEAVPMALDILYEDDSLIVLNKPAGLTVHPAPGERNATLVHGLLHHCGESLSGIGGVQRPGIVHRLDKDTSGAMLVAKSDVAHQSLSAQLKDRSLSRTYHALVYGLPNPATGQVEGAIGRSDTNRKKMAVLADDDPRGKAALTYYKVIETFGAGALSLIECKLQTGRTHQIRVHMAHRGHSLVGDAHYGRPRKLADAELRDIVRAFPRQALHAVAVGFIHPITGEKMQFEAAYPEDWHELLQNVRRVCRAGS